MVHLLNTFQFLKAVKSLPDSVGDELGAILDPFGDTFALHFH